MRYILALLSVLLFTPSYAQQGPVTPGYTTNGTNYIAVSPTTPLPTTATITGSVTALTSGTATVAAPSYVEGTSNPLSMNLTGDLRTIAKQGTSPWVVSNGGTFAVQATISGALAAGTNIIGKVGIDQTTDITTNGVEIAPTAGAAAGITSVVSASAENNHVLKAGAGNLYGAYATNLTSTAGFFVIVNATSAPTDGAITPLACIPLPGNSSASISRIPGPPQVYSTGITAVVTSASTCFTKTTGVITAFISGDVK